MLSTDRLCLGRVLDTAAEGVGVFSLRRHKPRITRAARLFTDSVSGSALGLPTGSGMPSPVLQAHPAGMKSNVPQNPRALLSFELVGMIGAGDLDRSALGPEAPRPISGLRTWHAK